MEMNMMNQNKNDDNNTGAAASAASALTDTGRRSKSHSTPGTHNNILQRPRQRRRLDNTSSSLTPNRINVYYEEWKKRPPPYTAVDTEGVLLDSEEDTSNTFPSPDNNELVCTQLQSWVLESVYASTTDSSPVATNRTVRS